MLRGQPYNSERRPWNNGEPAWNKGKQVGKPLHCECGHCGKGFTLETGSKSLVMLRYRARRGDVAYCSESCRQSGKSEKISRALMGHTTSPETKAAMRNGLMAAWADPAKRREMIASQTGRRHSVETLAKMSAARKSSPKAIAQRARMHSTFKGSNSPHWKGGITPEHHAIRMSVKMRDWRMAVMLRDDYTCQICGTRGGPFNADHIKPFSKFKELRFELSNGRTLCQDCHRRTPTYGRRRELHASA